MHVIFVVFWSPPSRPQRRPRGPKRLPRGAQEAPRPPQEGSKPPPRGPKEPPRGFKSAPGGPKRNPRDPRSRSRGLKIFQDRPSRLQNTPKTWRNTIPKTIADINVADIAEIDKNLKRFTRGAVVNGRAGGGVPPWGRQSAARNEVEELAACQIG